MYYTRSVIRVWWKKKEGFLFCFFLSVFLSWLSSYYRRWKAGLRFPNTSWCLINTSPFHYLCSNFFLLPVLLLLRPVIYTSSVTCFSFSDVVLVLVIFPHHISMVDLSWLVQQNFFQVLAVLNLHYRSFWLDECSLAVYTCTECSCWDNFLDSLIESCTALDSALPWLSFLSSIKHWILIQTVLPPGCSILFQEILASLQPFSPVHHPCMLVWATYLKIFHVASSTQAHYTIVIETPQNISADKNVRDFALSY